MLTCEQYLRPRTLDQAFDTMKRERGRYRLLAGATDMLPWAREGRAGDVEIPVLIDVTRIPELTELKVGSRVRFGAATPIQRFLDHVALAKALPCMPRMAVWFADDQIRESATIGGNLVNASPAADAVPPLIALEADVELAAKRDGAIVRRTLPLTDFITGPGRTALADDEILLALTCNSVAGYGAAFEKVGHRRSLVISVACVAALVRLDPTGRVFEEARLAIGGIGPVPVRAAEVEAFLSGKPVSDEFIEEVARMPAALVRSRSRQLYRQEVLRGFVARALVTAAKFAGASPDALTPELEAHYA